MIPAVSVVMSVYNGERYLAKAIDSILCQTFRDFEFIIIDDGSTDGTAEMLARYANDDSRIAVHHQSNQGIVNAENAGCRLARGRYIARMDQDDIAVPERIERQIEFLERNAAVAVVGSSVEIIDVAGNSVFLQRLPSADAEIRRSLFETHQMPFAHPTLMFRTEAFHAVNGYRKAFVAADDFDLCIRIAERWQLANLADPILRMRRHAASFSMRNIRTQVMTILCAWAAAAIRARRGNDPSAEVEVITRELVRSMGVSDTVFEQSLMGVYLYWVDVMLQGSDKPAAVRIMREALESEPWKHINRSVVANTWLAAAQIYSEQGQHLESLTCAARAFATRPIIAGRPIKRFATYMGLA